MLKCAVNGEPFGHTKGGHPTKVGRRHIRAGTWASPLPHLHRDWTAAMQASATCSMCRRGSPRWPSRTSPSPSGTTRASSTTVRHRRTPIRAVWRQQSASKRAAATVRAAWAGGRSAPELGETTGRECGALRCCCLVVVLLLSCCCRGCAGFGALDVIVSTLKSIREWPRERGCAPQSARSTSWCL